jgi:hypothetical protein
MTALTSRVSRAWRRLTLMLVALAVAALTLPGFAVAAAPGRILDTAYVTGGSLTTPGGTIEFDAGFSTLMGPTGWLTYLGPNGPVFGPQGYTELSGSRLSGEFSLNDDTGQHVGFAFFVIDFTADGPETTIEDVVRDGNRRVRMEFTEQPMLASGTLTLPDGTVTSFDGLPANRFAVDQWSTNPAATILDGSETFIDALWMLGETPLGFRVHATELESSAVVYLYVDDGEIIGTGRPTFSGNTFSWEVELTHSNGTPRGSAQVSLEVVELESTARLVRTPISFERVITTDHVIVGELTLTLDGVTTVHDFGEADLFSLRQAWHGIQYPFAEGGEG